MYKGSEDDTPLLIIASLLKEVWIIDCGWFSFLIIKAWVQKLED